MAVAPGSKAKCLWAASLQREGPGCRAIACLKAAHPRDTTLGVGVMPGGPRPRHRPRKALEIECVEGPWTAAPPHVEGCSPCCPWTPQIAGGSWALGGEAQAQGMRPFRG